MQDSVSVSVTEDDGDDDENNDDLGEAASGNGTDVTTTTTTTTTTPRPKMYRNRFRGGAEMTFKRYAVRASKVVSLVDAEKYRAKQADNRRRRVGAVDVECRLRVPGDGTGGGRWKADRPADHYYGAHRSVAYKYRGAEQQPSGDAFAAVSSASSVDDDAANDAPDQDADSGAATPSTRTLLFVLATGAVSCLFVAFPR